MAQTDSVFRELGNLLDQWHFANMDVRAAHASVVRQFRDFARGEAEPPSPSAFEECERLESVADRVAEQLKEAIRRGVPGV
jgi:hypothetical protein